MTVATATRPASKTKAGAPLRVLGEARSPIGRVDNAPKFSVWRVIDDALAAADSPDPAELVDVVMKKIAMWEREDALRQLLGPAIKKRALPGAPDITGERDEKRSYNSLGGPSKSDKWDAISSATRDPLRYSVRVAGGEFKFLGECTAEDVRYLEQQRFKAAKTQLGKAKQYRRLHKAMIAAEAETVADLGGEKVAEIIQ